MDHDTLIALMAASIYPAMAAYDIDLAHRKGLPYPGSDFASGIVDRAVNIAEAIIEEEQQRAAQ